MTEEKRILKPEFQAMFDEWDEEFDGGNCSCHINPPCSSCTHEGNPANLEEVDDAWE